jgi:hypothetical protein
MSPARLHKLLGETCARGISMPGAIKCVCREKEFHRGRHDSPLGFFFLCPSCCNIRITRRCVSVLPRLTKMLKMKAIEKAAAFSALLLLTIVAVSQIKTPRSRTVLAQQKLWTYSQGIQHHEQQPIAYGARAAQ